MLEAFKHLTKNQETDSTSNLGGILNTNWLKFILFDSLCQSSQCKVTTSEGLAVYNVQNNAAIYPIKVIVLNGDSYNSLCPTKCCTEQFCFFLNLSFSKTLLIHRKGLFP